MKLKEYKEKGTRLVDLPSGIKARLRQVKVMPYVISGSFPNLYALDSATESTPDLEHSSNLLTNIVCDSVQALVFEDCEMRLVNKPERECLKDELSYTDSLTNEDATVLLSYAFADLNPAEGGAGNLNSFRSSTRE